MISTVTGSVALVRERESNGKTYVRVYVEQTGRAGFVELWADKEELGPKSVQADTGIEALVSTSCKIDKFSGGAALSHRLESFTQK